MFTGIIEVTAKVLKLDANSLTLERPAIFDDIKIGSSIAVSGVCLSVIAFDDSSMSFDVVETTLRKTKLGSLKSGDSVNLERAMRADARFEGHIVTGHCESVGKILEIKNNVLVFQIVKNLIKFIVQHGSIALDGVALTVAEISGDNVSVALIPHTLAHTTLGTSKAGDSLNIETDILGKYILRTHHEE